MALTFDDGPDPVWTPRVLAALAATDARATFFVLGDATERHPDVVRAIMAAGHAVELHGFGHVRHTALDRAALEADTDRALAILAGLGVAATRWRTPWGVLGPDTDAVAAARGLELVHWTADTEDWDGAPADVLLTRVAGELRDGAIVLAHDGVGPGARRDGCAETVALIPALAAAARTAGLTPGPLPPATPGGFGSLDPRPRSKDPKPPSGVPAATGAAAC